jgi:hypothetical protein
MAIVRDAQPNPDAVILKSIKAIAGHMPLYATNSLARPVLLSVAVFLDRTCTSHGIVRFSTTREEHAHLLPELGPVAVS